MTTSSQWAEIMDWVSERFPNHPWAVEQALAYFDDIQEFDASDVWSGLYTWYEAGQAFPPNGSQLRAKAIEARRSSARDDMYRQALPAATERDAEPVDETTTYAERRFDDGPMTGIEMIARIHAAMPPAKCGNPECSDHNAMTATN